MKKYYLIFSIVAFFNSVHSQNFNQYEPLKSSGNIPAEVITMSSEKYEADKGKETKSNDSRKVRKAKDKFILESHFHVDAMLRSGLVLFNDPLSVYIEKVGNELIKNEPSLKGKIHFHILKSAIPNAMVTHEGYVFVTMGLLARLNNEAELAFILSHELTHFVKKHSINKVVEFTKRKSGLSDAEANLSRCAYSRDLESEADLEGMSIFSKSKYQLDAATSTMDILSYSHAPYFDVELPVSFFESEGLRVDSSAIYTKGDNITSDAEKDDSMSTHPNTSKRKIALSEKIKSISTEGRQAFIVVDAAEFLRLRKIARFELPYMYLNRGMYCESLYYAWIMLQEEPESEFLKGIMLRSLYAASKFSYKRKLREVIVDHYDVQGNIQKVAYLIKNLEHNYLTVLTIRKLFEHLQTNKNDSDIKRLYLDLFTVLEGTKESDFKDLGNVDLKNRPEETYNHEYGLTGIKNDPLIKEGFAFAAEKVKSIEELEEKYKNKRKNKDFFKLPENQKYVKRNNNYALNIPKVVVVEPLYIKGDMRKETKIKHEASEKTLVECLKDMETQAQKLNMTVDILSPYQFKQTDIEKFNLLQDLKELNSQIAFYESEEIRMEPFYYSKLMNMSNQMGTDYFMFTGVASFQVPKNIFAKILVIMNN